MKFSLIIPTYNEKDNINILINRLLKILQPFDYEIIVVDDNSPDKTWETVQDRYRKNKQIRVIRRIGKRGLISAITHGFDNAKGVFVGVMDADMQHDEKILPKMIKYTKNYDVVVGSRFVKGGGVKNWSLYRKITSRVAGTLANILLGIKIKDNGSGYFIVKKSIYKKAKSKLYGKGYRCLFDIYFNANVKNFKEVPYIFGPRKKGESKLGFNVILQYLQMLIKFSFIRHNRFIKFCLVGLSGAVVNLGLLYILTEFAGFFYLISSIIAIEISIITNFLLNNAWTWNDRRKKGAFFSRLGKFNLVSIGSLVINAGILYLLTSFAGIYYIISNMIGIVAAALWNFFVNHYWTFKK
jgi:dolichol-phosphate mannosyltransferase